MKRTFSRLQSAFPLAPLALLALAASLIQPGQSQTALPVQQAWNFNGNHLYNANSGNVGIGTNSPAAKLHVNGLALFSGFQLGTSATPGYVLTANASGVGTWQALPAGNTYTAGAGLSLSGNAFSIPANGVTSAMISDVAWSKITGEPTSFPPSGPAGGDLRGSYPNPDIGADRVNFDKLASDARSLFKVSDGAMSAQNGNIGIGSAPTPARLTVTGGAGPTSFQIWPGRLDNADSANWVTLEIPGNCGLRVWDMLSVSDNLGVGTTTPGAKLDVNGTARMTGFQLGSSATAGYVLTANASGVGTWQAATGLSLPYSGSAGASISAFSVTNNGGGSGIKGSGSVTGVEGHATLTGDGDSNGVAGYADSISGSGVYGDSVGVRGYGVLGFNQGASAYGVYSVGRFAATGTKQFQIDHPLDPENKVLNHFCTEGAEPLNAYSGNVVTDAHGEAWVSLPDYFEEINRDFRYQLTVMEDEDTDGPYGADAFCMAKVSRKIHNNRFLIKTSTPRVEVSWRVEGVRNDRWVRTHGFQAEEEKPEARRGTYLMPELYGQPAEKSQFYSFRRRASLGQAGLESGRPNGQRSRG